MLGGGGASPLNTRILGQPTQLLCVFFPTTQRKLSDPELLIHIQRTRDQPWPRRCFHAASGRSGACTQTDRRSSFNILSSPPYIFPFYFSLSEGSLVVADNCRRQLQSRGKVPAFRCAERGTLGGPEIRPANKQKPHRNTPK